MLICLLFPKFSSFKRILLGITFFGLSGSFVISVQKAGGFRIHQSSPNSFWIENISKSRHVEEIIFGTEQLFGSWKLFCLNLNTLLKGATCLKIGILNHLPTETRERKGRIDTWSKDQDLSIHFHFRFVLQLIWPFHVGAVHPVNFSTSGFQTAMSKHTKGETSNLVFFLVAKMQWPFRKLAPRQECLNLTPLRCQDIGWGPLRRTANALGVCIQPLVFPQSL